ncbi:mannonate dehydratase [Algivirga pacifica]|uniref:Mannonate dehydratase n=1 Tax=Algivirga pacifica TaxID=1162670 RepID=A0ABP9D5D4_9BACT
MLEKTWRWYGPKDFVTLDQVAQAGATGVVTALHHLPNGVVWSKEEIMNRKQEVEAANLHWSVVESVPVHEEIKLRKGDYQNKIEAFKQTLKNLGECGIDTVCYNFMPVLDWTRTDLNFELPNKATALRFDRQALVVFDVFLLQRSGAEKDYTPALIQEAQEYYEKMTSQEKDLLVNTILAGLPGAEENYSLADFRLKLQEYAEVTEEVLRANLIAFLQEVVPVAQEAGVKLAIHPDDPPFSLFGLPRIVSTESDLEHLLSAVDYEANGWTLCTGSLGARKENDVLRMLERFSHRIHFVHLRNVAIEEDGSFYEANHLEGQVNMYEVIQALLKEQSQRKGERSTRMPMRPDHGHRMLDDLHKTVNPGYSAIGRLKGLAELRGVEFAILNSIKEEVADAQVV